MEECAQLTHIIFPYRGVYVHHVGSNEAVAEANQVLFLNAEEGYRISHPVAGGDACLSLAIDEAVLREVAPKEHVREGGLFAFRHPGLRIDARVQALVAGLRYSLAQNMTDALEAETSILTLVRRVLGEQPAHARSTGGRRKLVDRAKLVMSSDPARRWTLADIGAEVGVSPVYLTQVFQQVEAMPLYRYQLHLRLARALDLLAECSDLARLGLDLGFSSHSHFSAAFRRIYGCTPAHFQRSLRLRPSFSNRPTR
jgi:AraC-like DNA-binding protein